MIDSSARKSVSRNIFFVLLFIGFGLFVCGLSFFLSVRSSLQLEAIASPKSRIHIHRFRFNTAESWRGLVRYIREGDESQKEKFLAWCKNLEDLQASIQDSWLNDCADEIELNKMLKLQEELRILGSEIVLRAEVGEPISTNDIAAFRSAGNEFTKMAAATSDFAAERMGRAHEQLFAKRQQLHLVVAATLALSLVLMLAVTFILRRNFNEYVSIKEASEKRIIESEERFRKIFDNEPQCVKLFDLDGKLLDMNPAGLEMIGAKCIDDVRGESVYDLIAPKFRQFFIDSAHQLTDQDEIQHIDFDILSLSGTRRSMQSYQVPIRGEQGELLSILAITYDVTQKKKSEKELKELKDAMVNAGRVNVMGELASNMAHELNQPLTSTVNFAYMLDAEIEKIDSPVARQLASLILTESMRASKIVAGLRRLVDKQPSVTELEDLNSVVQQTVPLLLEEIKSQQIELVQKLSPSLPQVKCDKVQIQQVLYNLARNAMDAFAAAGSYQKKQLILETRIAAGKKYVEMTVTDTAKGIPDSQIESIFDPFVSHNENGLGMGLAISKSIANAHSGILKVTSTVGEGTCFRLLLPLESQESNLMKDASAV